MRAWADSATKLFVHLVALQHLYHRVRCTSGTIPFTLHCHPHCSARVRGPHSSDLVSKVPHHNPHFGGRIIRHVEVFGKAVCGHECAFYELSASCSSRRHDLETLHEMSHPRRFYLKKKATFLWHKSSATETSDLKQQLKMESRNSKFCN